MRLDNSTNRAVRVVYTLMSTFVYNIWVLANIVFAGSLRVELKGRASSCLRWRIILESKLSSPTSLPKPTCGTTVLGSSGRPEDRLEHTQKSGG